MPTWNYIAVHVCGPLRLRDDSEWLLAHVIRLPDRKDAGRADPWSISDAPADYIARLLEGIVGSEMEVTRLKAWWKMSQNRTSEDIDGVVAGLGASGHPEDSASRRSEVTPKENRDSHTKGMEAFKSVLPFPRELRGGTLR